MNITNNDIIITIVLKNSDGYIDPHDMIFALDIIEQALYKSDLHDIQEISKNAQYSQITYDVIGSGQMIIDAAESRLRKYKHRRLRIYRADTGSIIIGGIVAGVSIWVLKNTIGEALKEGFRESNVYPKLKNLFKDIFNSKGEIITHYLREALLGKRKVKSDVVYKKGNEETPSEIILTIKNEREEENGTKSIGEVLKR